MKISGVLVFFIFKFCVCFDVIETYVSVESDTQPRLEGCSLNRKYDKVSKVQGIAKYDQIFQ